MVGHWIPERGLTNAHYHTDTSLSWIQLMNGTLTTNRGTNSWVGFCAGLWNLGTLTFNLRWHWCHNNKWVLGRDIWRRFIWSFTFCGKTPRKGRWWNLLLQLQMKVYFIIMLIGWDFTRTWWRSIRHKFQSLWVSLCWHLLLLTLTMIQMLSLGDNIQV